MITDLAKIAVPNVADLMSHQDYTPLETMDNHRRAFTGKGASMRCWYSKTVREILATRGVISKATTRCMADDSSRGYFLEIQQFAAKY